MACGKCVHWNARLDKRGRRINSGDPYLQCKAPEPELPNLPASIRVNNGYGGLMWPPKRDSMGAKDGEGCPLFGDWKAIPEA